MLAAASAAGSCEDKLNPKQEENQRHQGDKNRLAESGEYDDGNSNYECYYSETHTPPADPRRCSCLPQNSLQTISVL